MLDIIKRAAYTGMGLAFLTREKAGELARELAENAKLSEREGRDLYNDLVSRSETAGRELRERIDTGVKDAMTRMNMASRDDVIRLEKQLAALREEIAVLRSAREQG